MIPKDTIDEILMRTDIESLISGYVSLKRTSDTYKGLCPFHSEKSPSFTVYPKTSSFYCFGCGIGGDAVTFVKQIEHLDYPDAIEFLAKRAGITIVDDDKYARQEKKVDRNRMYKMNADAASFFHRCLISNIPGAKDALAYFTEKRGLSTSIIKHFGLGYAPDSFDMLSKHMRSLGYSYDELTEAFLCGKSESGKYYDAFRNRVMFPIIDVAGNVIGFGGRAMDNETKPKYKNTADTPVYKKTRNVFALNFARHTCQEKLILCEGYMDVIALHSAGLTNAIATLGTAITSDQARLMRNYTKQVVICYDSDEPGQKAAQKALRVLGEVGLDVRVIVIPGSKDPDEYIKTFGADKMRDVINNAKAEFEYKMDNILSKLDINLAQDKVKAIQLLENEISNIYSQAERDIYINIVATYFSIDQSSVKADVERMIKARLKAQRSDTAEDARKTLLGYQDRVNPDYARAPAVARHEETVLGLLMLYPEHRKKVFEDKWLVPDDFFTALNKRIFEYVSQTYYDEAPGDINEIFTPEEVGRITKMKLARMNLLNNGDDVLLESINALKSSMLKKSVTACTSIDEMNDIIKRLRSDDNN